MRPASPVSLLDPGGECDVPNRPGRATADSLPSWELKAPHPHPETAQAESSASSKYPKANKGSRDSPQHQQTPSHPNPPDSTSVGIHLLSSAQDLSWQSEAFSFSRSSQPKKLQMIFTPPRCCSGIKFRLAESQSRGGIASLEPPPSAMSCHFQVVHVKKPEGAWPLRGSLRAHTHTRVCPNMGIAPSRLRVQIEGVHRGGRRAVMRWVRSQGQRGGKTRVSSFPQGSTCVPLPPWK